MSENHDLTQKLLKLEVLHFLNGPVSLLLHSFQETQKFQSRLQNFRWLLTTDKLIATKLGKCKILTCMSFNTFNKYSLGSDALSLISEDSKSKTHQTDSFYI